MAADLKSHLISLLQQALTSLAPDYQDTFILLESPKIAAHGDYASNIALQLAKPLKLNPRDIATRLLAALPPSPWLSKAEVAGAGFINLFLTPAAKQQIVSAILMAGSEYGRSKLGTAHNTQQKIQIEFVSANPTGPLHVGHGRGAAYGASLANILAFSGYQVTQEYYVNDAGRQMDILALSTWLRYLALHNDPIDFPKNAYQGSYVNDMALQIKNLHGKRYVRLSADILANVPDARLDPEAHLDGLIANTKHLLGASYKDIHHHVLTEQLNDCREDLAEFGVQFDAWFSENSLYDTGRVESTLESLDKLGYIYVQEGAKWFRSTQFGDEKDRVVQRENGIYTYFASDIAYHLNKYQRGFDRMIDIWGADHHGYIPRVKGAITALGLNATKLDIALVQFAVLYRNGQKAAMSTRSGEFVTLRELRHEVGNDAARFFYVLRQAAQHLDFDLDLAKSQTNENPVYYIQYAHARICSVLSQWGGNPDDLKTIELSGLHSERELMLCSCLAVFPDIIHNAARDYAPHLVAFYLKELAGEFHSYYNAERILVEDEKIRHARLALAVAARQVLANGLRLLGVTAPETM